MTSWGHQTKNTTTYSQQTKNATTFSGQNRSLPLLLIGDGYFLLIEGSQRLIIESAAAHGAWSFSAKN